MEIIPAIYILDGKCVALYKNSYEQKSTYFKSPLQMASLFQEQGAEKLHIVDLNGCRDNGLLQKKIIKNLILGVQIPVQIEAGFNNPMEIKTAFELGAAKIVLRPNAFSLIKEAIETYGTNKIIAEILAKGSSVIGGGKTEADRDIDVVDFAEKLVTIGVKEIIYKDERSEGTLIHPNYDEVDRLFLITGKDLQIYVSGGISEFRHLKLLKKIGASGAIIGKAFYEKLLNVEKAKAAVVAVDEGK